jgi:ADP-heptose:LPS heptosyltransferase
MCTSMLDCTHFVSNDSGLMNIANALGIPTLALFAPTNAKTRLPLAPSSTAIVLEKDCAPCELKDPEGFSRGQCRCMDDIDVEVVEERLFTLMDEPLTEIREFACAR